MGREALVVPMDLRDGALLIRQQDHWGPLADPTDFLTRHASEFVMLRLR